MERFAAALTGFALRRRSLMLGFLACVLIAGVLAFLRLDIEA